MKIAILQDDFPSESFGGAAVMAHDLAIGLLELGHEVIVITSTAKSNFVEVVDGLKIYRLHSKPFGFFKYYLSLCNSVVVRGVKKILKDEKPDIVHCHNLNSALSYHCLRVAQKITNRVFLTAHDTMLFSFGKLSNKKYLNNFDTKITWYDQIRQAGKQYNPFRNFLIRRYYLTSVSKIFAISESLKNALLQNGISNTAVIHNGLKIEDFQVNEKEISDFKVKHGLQNKKIIFVGGRLSRPKGGGQILAALKIILEGKNKNIMLVVAAPRTDYVSFFEKFCEKNGIRQNVLFLGQVPHEQMKIIYGASDVVVYPSIYLDPFGLINIEAMASKKPVVGTSFGGTQDIVLDGQTGYIVNPFDVSAMAEKIVELLDDVQKAKNFGLNGYERVKKEFSLDKQIQETLKYYQAA